MGADVAILIRRAREARGWSQKELASALGTSQPYIARLEAGKQSPTQRTLDRIAAVLGYTLSVTFSAPTSN